MQRLDEREAPVRCYICGELIYLTARAHGVYTTPPDEFETVMDLDDISEVVHVHAGSCLNEYTARRIREAEGCADLPGMAGRCS